MSAGKMILHPEPALAAPADPIAITVAMQEIGLLGPALASSASEPMRFLAGDRFLQLVTFLGCSPHIELSPPTEGSTDFCYLQLLGPWPEPRLIHGTNTRPPGCPSCGKRGTGLLESIAPWSEVPASAIWTCGHCGESRHPGDWNWRQQGGAARIALLINDIFPSEALPAPSVLKTLAAIDGRPWRYCYLQDNR